MFPFTFFMMKGETPLRRIWDSYAEFWQAAGLVLPVAGALDGIGQAKTRGTAEASRLDESPAPPCTSVEVPELAPIAGPNTTGEPRKAATTSKASPAAERLKKPMAKPRASQKRVERRIAKLKKSVVPHTGRATATRRQAGKASKAVSTPKALAHQRGKAKTTR